MELRAPPNDSDNRSEAVSVGNGGRVFSIGFDFGWDRFTRLGDGATAFFARTPWGCAGNEIRATSIARSGASTFDWNWREKAMSRMIACRKHEVASPLRKEGSSEKPLAVSPRAIRLGEAVCPIERTVRGKLQWFLLLGFQFLDR